MSKKTSDRKLTTAQRRVLVDVHVVFARMCTGRNRRSAALTTDSLMRRWGYRAPASRRELVTRARAVARGMETLDGHRVSLDTPWELARIRRALAERPSVRPKNDRDRFFDEAGARQYARDLTVRPK